MNAFFTVWNRQTRAKILNRNLYQLTALVSDKSLIQCYNMMYRGYYVKQMNKSICRSNNFFAAIIPKFSIIFHSSTHERNYSVFHFFSKYFCRHNVPLGIKHTGVVYFRRSLRNYSYVSLRIRTKRYWYLINRNPL